MYLFKLYVVRLNKDMILLHGIKFHVIFLLNNEIFRFRKEIVDERIF